MASDDEALAIAMDLCRRFEGFRARPYLCPAGIPTIGYGATVYLGGRKVTLADPPISQGDADQLLQDLLERVYLPAARNACPQARGAHLAALADFAFNLGCTRLATSTLRRRFNAGDMAGAREEIRKWVRGGGRVLPGLVARREAEAALLTDDRDD
jgi:lysozyme